MHTIYGVISIYQLVFRVQSQGTAGASAASVHSGQIPGGTIAALPEGAGSGEWGAGSGVFPVKAGSNFS